MQSSIKSLIGYAMRATDGDIGAVTEFYFDDNNGIIRYLIVKTGSWLSGLKELISPQSVQKVDFEEKEFIVNLTKEQIEHSPDIDTDKPISRRQEIELYGHYAWQRYSGNGFYAGSLWPVLPATIGLNTGMTIDKSRSEEERDFDPHLRSTDIVNGYHIHASDGDIGHVNDFIVDTETWQILYFVVDTHNWIGGKKVLIGVNQIKEISWKNSKVTLNIPIDAVKESPLFDESKYGFPVM